MNLKKQSKANFASLNSSSYYFLSIMFVSVMLISNIVASKSVTLFPGLEINLGFIHTKGILTDGAFFLFPLSYAVGDVISEIFGYKVMRKTILYGFVMMILASTTFQIATKLPVTEGYDNQIGFNKTLGITWIFLLAALAGYVCGELLNSYVLVSLKKQTGEPKLWLRLIASTVVGEFLDTLVFCGIVAKPGLGIDNLSDFINYASCGFVWKCTVEFVLLPITYTLVHYLKKYEPTYGNY